MVVFGGLVVWWLCGVLVWWCGGLVVCVCGCFVVLVGGVAVWCCAGVVVRYGPVVNIQQRQYVSELCVSCQNWCCPRPPNVCVHMFPY